jgi:hypothetical protein
VRTSDGFEITHDLHVWTNDFRRESVVIDDLHRPHEEAGEWWFYVLEDGAPRPTISSKSRVTTRDPRPPWRGVVRPAPGRRPDSDPVRRGSAVSGPGTDAATDRPRTPRDVARAPGRALAPTALLPLFPLLL